MSLGRVESPPREDRPLTDDEDAEESRLLSVLDKGLVDLLLDGGGENLKSSPQLDEDLLLLSAAKAAAKGSAVTPRPLDQAELLLFPPPKGLSKLELEGVVDTVPVKDAKGSLSREKGSKEFESLLLLLFFRIPLGVVTAAKGSSEMAVKGSSPKPTSLKGSSVNSSSAYRCCCDSLVAFFVLLLLLPHASKISPADELVN